MAPIDSVCFRSQPADLETLAPRVYRQVCRVDHSVPGFCAINLGPALDSQVFRQFMVDLKKALAALHEKTSGQTLVYLSAARFDQQVTTRPHLDGGPEECFLMLGYEPSEVDSEMEITDYARCAFDLGLTPKEFLEKHNPMFHRGRELIEPYTQRVPCFDKADYRVVCINNASAPFDREQPRWQGTLHTAAIFTPDPAKRRVINSTMIASAPLGTTDSVSSAEQADFVRTAVVHRKGYDQLDLEDDGEKT